MLGFTVFFHIRLRFIHFLRFTPDIDFQGAKITSDTGFLVLREIDGRFGVIGPMGEDLEDPRSRIHAKHSLVHMIRQKVYQSRLADVSFCLSVVDQNSKRSSTGFPVARDSLASS
ncbi:MAG: transposase [Syntrophales bacterium]